MAKQLKSLLGKLCQEVYEGDVKDNIGKEVITRTRPKFYVNNIRK